MGVDVWTEVLNEGIVAVWVWDGFRLGTIAHSMDGYHLDEGSLDALSQYANDKETNLTVQDMYDESDFDGTVEEFVNQEVRV